MTNWIQKIGNSVTGIIFGIILLTISVGVLFWNEGRVNQADLARRAIPLSANETQENQAGTLVALTGLTNSDQLLGDGVYLNPGNYLAVDRTVEIFAWKEEAKTENEQTTYTYSKIWTEMPEDSSEFKDPTNHQNSSKTIENQRLINDATFVGDYFFEADKTGLSRYEELTLNDKVISITALDSNTLEDSQEVQESEIVEQNYVFLGQGSLTEPKIGDQRVSYQVVNPGETVTIFGKLQDFSIAPYRYNENDLFYELREGTYDEAINSFNNEYNTGMWIFRIVGFVLMWIALLMLLSPVQVTLNLIPVIGPLAKNFLTLFTFLLAGIFSILTIFFSIIVHNLFLLILIIVIIGFALTLYFYRRKVSLEKSQNSPVQEAQFMSRQQVLSNQTGKVHKAAGVRQTTQKKTITKKEEKPKNSNSGKTKTGKLKIEDEAVNSSINQQNATKKKKPSEQSNSFKKSKSKKIYTQSSGKKTTARSGKNSGSKNAQNTKSQ